MTLYEVQVYVDRGDVGRAAYPLWRDGMVICAKPWPGEWASSQLRRAAIIACSLTEPECDNLLGVMPNSRRRASPLRINWRGLVGEEMARRVLDQDLSVDPVYLDPLPTFDRLTEEQTPW